MRRSKIAAGQTRQNILDAALTLFDEQGYAQTSINAIAGHIGATRGAVYGHFANKEAILAALAEAEINTLMARNAAAIAGKNVWQGLGDNLIQFFDELRACPVRLRLFRIIHQQKQSSETMQELRCRNEALWHEQCREAVARGKANGELPADADADYVFFHISVVISGLFEYCLHSCPHSDIQPYIARTIRTTMASLQK